MGPAVSWKPIVYIMFHSHSVIDSTIVSCICTVSVRHMNTRFPETEKWGVSMTGSRRQLTSRVPLMLTKPPQINSHTYLNHPRSYFSSLRSISTILFTQRFLHLWLPLRQKQVRVGIQRFYNKWTYWNQTSVRTQSFVLENQNISF